MDYKEYNVDLQIKENHIDIVRGIVQFDGANIFNLRLMDGIKPLNFSSYTHVEAFIKKPDETTISDLIGIRLQETDPEKGKLSFLLNGQCTIIPGMYYLTIRIYDGKTVLSTARLNYYVTEANVPDVTEEELQSSTEWNSLVQIIAKWAAVEVAEAQRVLAEQGRVAAEELRVSETEGIIARAIIERDAAADYARNAKAWAELAQHITVEDLPVITKAELNQELTVIDGNAESPRTRSMRIKRGLLENIPSLPAGELYYATDTGGLYIGSALGNFQLNKPAWIADSDPPADTSALWIDINNDNCIKYYDGTSWVNTSGARFT